MQHLNPPSLQTELDALLKSLEHLGVLLQPNTKLCKIGLRLMDESGEACFIMELLLDDGRVLVFSPIISSEVA